MQNLLYCMGMVNACLDGSGTTGPACANYAELRRLHNLGYDLLKTPYPQGSPGRNWSQAIRCLEDAVKLAPDCAPSYHLLGLAYEGAKQDAKALEAWWKVRQLDYNFDFQNETQNLGMEENLHEEELVYENRICKNKKRNFNRCSLGFTFKRSLRRVCGPILCRTCQ